MCAGEGRCSGGRLEAVGLLNYLVGQVRSRARGRGPELVLVMPTVVLVLLLTVASVAV